MKKDKNWSVSFEQEEYEENIDRMVQESIEAVESTAAGYYVNLVTPAVFGNPDDFLTEVLKGHFQDSIRTAFIDQCGCGGYVLRVWKNP